MLRVSAPPAPADCNDSDARSVSRRRARRSIWSCSLCRNDSRRKMEPFGNASSVSPPARSSTWRNVSPRRTRYSPGNLTSPSSVTDHSESHIGIVLMLK